jgi:acetyl-CoA carboxylase biotin carboxyl carrier protein
MNLEEIKDLIKLVSKSGLGKVEIEREGFRISIKGSQSEPVMYQAAPMVAAPDKDPFVNVGDGIQKGDKVCIIEAMKTFNEIESEISGKIVKVLVDNASPVDYDQPLFLVDPA